MPSSTLPILLLGTSNIGPTPLYTHHTPASQNALLASFKAAGLRRIDTASVYGITEEYGPGGSERVLASLGVTGEKGEKEGWVVDTKILIKGPGSHAGNAIRESLEASLKNLRVEKVNIAYLHAPDRTTPLAHVVKEMDKLFKEGKFAKFGLSNYSAEEVEEILNIASAQSLNPPSVYQGNYSILCRRADTALFPLLRKHNMAFYAYSPLAMGLAAGRGKASPEEAKEKEGSRFHPSSRKASVFQGIWFKPNIFLAVQHLNSLRPDSSPLSLSLRWIAYHSALDASYGDGIILGASSSEQLEKTLEVLLKEGPLSEEEQAGMEEVWRLVGEDAPPYSD